MALLPDPPIPPETLARCPCCERVARIDQFQTLPCDVVRCLSCLAPVEVVAPVEPPVEAPGKKE